MSDREDKARAMYEADTEYRFPRAKPWDELDELAQRKYLARVDNDPKSITRGDIRRLISKLQSNVWEDYSNETGVVQQAVNRVMDALSKDLNNLLDEI